jgi:lysophospholipase L1-like esterase
MANIGCVRSIATDGAARAALDRRWRRLTAALLLPGALLLGAADLPSRPLNADPTFPFSREIEAFAQADDAGPPVANATLFLGSSSIRLWDIRRGFPDIPTVNRGFGGATTPDVLHYYARLLPRTEPRSVIVYVGENDLAAGGEPDKVARDVLTLLGKLRADYPRAHILYLSLKPSPIRWTLWPKLSAVNEAVARRAGAATFDYLDVSHALLAPDGLPDASLFRPDGLHMNPRGYALWNALVEEWLDRAAPVAPDKKLAS